jgi:hypothetical protein
MASTQWLKDRTRKRTNASMENKTKELKRRLNVNGDSRRNTKTKRTTIS